MNAAFLCRVVEFLKICIVSAWPQLRPEMIIRGRLAARLESAMAVSAIVGCVVTFSIMSLSGACLSYISTKDLFQIGHAVSSQ